MTTNIRFFLSHGFSMHTDQLLDQDMLFTSFLHVVSQVIHVLH